MFYVLIIFKQMDQLPFTLLEVLARKYSRIVPSTAIWRVLHMVATHGLTWRQKKKKAFAVMASSTVHDLQCSLHWLRSNHPLSYLPKFKISGALSFSFVLAKNDDFCVSLFSVFMATYFSSGPYFFSPGLCLSLCLWTSTHGYISHWGRVVPGYATVLLKHSYYNQN